jgi:alpha-beta hydrolase superfamily lysophospholipase
MAFHLLVLCGDRDGVCSHKMAKRVADAAKGSDVEFQKLKGKDHHPLLSEGWESLAELVHEWFATRQTPPTK